MAALHRHTDYSLENYYWGWLSSAFFAPDFRSDSLDANRARIAHGMVFFGALGCLVFRGSLGSLRSFGSLLMGDALDKKTHKKI